ncbi:unnamed protein product, partial [Staurois parvus]
HSGSPINGKSRRGRLGHVISYVQSQLITSVPPASAHQCYINATFQCLPVHINAIYQCPSELPFSVSQCHLSVLPIIATHQCHLSVPSLPAKQCQSV